LQLDSNQSFIFLLQGGKVMTKVPNDLGVLLDVMAYNSHEQWCEAKIDDGYMYGATRDEHNKTHPEVLPFYMLMLDDDGDNYNLASAAASIMCVFNSGGQIKVARDRQNSVCGDNLGRSMGIPGKRAKDDGSAESMVMSQSMSGAALAGAPSPATAPTRRRSISQA
jgi:hypothetical protein